MKSKLILGLCIAFIAACTTPSERVEEHETIHEEIDMATMFPEPAVKIKTVGILLYDGFANLDAVGPFAVFTSLMETEVFFIGLHDGLVEDARGMKVQVDSTIDEVNQLDILLIPGGFKETVDLTKDEKLLDWIRKIDKTSTYTASVCTGAWILGATGLLEGKNATTHWYGKEILAEEYGANIQDTRYTNSGKYWTSAGVTAGMDMSLAMMKEIAGENYTKIVMLDLEYDPKPPVVGGSVSNTDKSIVDVLRSMYDSGMEAALNPAQANAEIKLINDKDPVCRMSVNSTSANILHLDSGIWGFCSSVCMEEFKNNPSKYLSAN